MLAASPESESVMAEATCSAVATEGRVALQGAGPGECVIDPAIISQMLSRRQKGGPFDELTDREREILGLMAEGHSNQAICIRLVISPRTVESHVRTVFMKLDLPESADSSCRGLAVLALLQA